MIFFLFLGFFLGVVALAAVEVAALFFVVDRLSRKKAAPPEPPEARCLDAGQSLVSAAKKQGIVWVLEPKKVPKDSSNGSPPRTLKEQKNKDVMEVFPVKKHAKIKGHSLVLLDLDGSEAIIDLPNCSILSVSASNLSSRKWAKRYPIKLESKNSVIYNGSKTCFLYLDTSWEKESWCKSLRLASCLDKQKLNWYGQLSEDFHLYLASLNAEYPSFLKPSGLYGEAIEKSSRIDGTSSKVRLFLKMITKKASKTGLESKANLTASSTRGERKIGEKLPCSQDVSWTDGLTNCSSEGNSANSSSHDLVQPTSPICNEKIVNDEGTLCLNLLFSRLFFDAKRSVEMKDFIKARIQRTLSNMRTPTYVGGVICTDLDLGNLPPYIHKLRLLPMDLNEMWAIEADIEYSGGIILDVETRLEVREPELQQDIINTSSEPSSFGEVTSDLLEGIEHYGKQLKSSSISASRMENKVEGEKVVADGLKQSKSSSWASSYVSRWKAIKQSFSEQVSQVPLSLAIRVVSLRGTLRLHLKPPPSDQLWFGFTSMPEIDWNLETSIGDRKISNTHIAVIISNRFKAAIRETLVLPNCECLSIPWMLAEKDDWVPRTAAPFIWVNRETTETEPSSHQSSTKSKPGSGTDSKAESKAGSSACTDDAEEKMKDVIRVLQQTREPLPEVPTPHMGQEIPASIDQPSDGEVGEELRVPLLRTSDVSQGSCDDGKSESSRALMVEEQAMIAADEDGKLKRSGRRARMLDLGRRVGERLEEKRRNLEEKSRNIVEKMRENSRN